MTLSTTLAKKTYDGDGATTAFPTVFKFLQNSHVVVTHVDASGGETVWAEGTHYSLTGAGSDSGGTVTVAISPTDYTPANGAQLVVSRNVLETQGIQYVEGGAFPSATHEQALDLVTMMMQKHSEEIARALLVPIAESSASALPGAVLRAGKYLAFDGDGAPVAAAPPEGGNVVSAFAATLLDDADAATARATLGALAPDGDGSALTGIDLLPAGSVHAYAGASVPSGYLLCDASIVSRTTYAALFAAIGETYGPGDSATTFQLPDLRGRVILGVGFGDAPDATGHALGEKEGTETHTLTESEIPAHNHTIWGTNASRAGNPQASPPYQVNNSLGGASGSAGGGAAHNNLQPSFSLNFIIKT